MKKNISVKQLMEVDSSIMKPYFDEWVVAMAFDDVCNHGLKHPDYKMLMGILSKHITIGKMIEILDNKWTKEEIFISRLEDFQWSVCFGLENYGLEYYEEIGDYDFICDKDELVDALWEAVKYILKED